MNTPTLSHLTLQTLDNYRAAANQAVVAYRLGSHRLVNVLNATLENSVYPRTAKLAPKATRRIDGVRGNVSDVVVKGIDQVAERTEQAIEMSSTAAAAQVKKVARFAAGIDNDIVAGGLQAAARFTLPGAKVALVVSGKVAEGAHALAGAAGARPARKANHKAARPTARTTARTTAGKSTVKSTVKAAVKATGETSRKTTTRTATAQVKRQAAPVVRRAKTVAEVSRQRVARVAKSVKAPAAPVVRAKSAAKRAAKKAVSAAKAA